MGASGRLIELQRIGIPGREEQARMKPGLLDGDSGHDCLSGSGLFGTLYTLRGACRARSQRPTLRPALSEVLCPKCCFYLQGGEGPELVGALYP